MPIFHDGSISSVFEMNQETPITLDPTLFVRIAAQVAYNFKQASESYTGTLYTSGPVRRKHSRITGIYKDCIREVFGESVASEFDCATCKNFLHYIGGLRGLASDGSHIDMLWDPQYVADAQLIPFFTQMHEKVSMQRTRAPLIIGKNNGHMRAIETQCQVNGDVVKFGYNHLGGYPHYAITMDASQLMIVDTWDDADKLQSKLTQSYEQVLVTLKEKGFTTTRIDRAMQILRSDLCDREEFVGKAGLPWWRSLVVELQERPAWHDVIIQKMCAKKTSFPFATFAMHSSSVWTLFEKLQEGADDRTAAIFFKNITRSDRYMRTTTEATEASVERAEKMIEELGVTSALRRRGATMEDLTPFLIWKSSDPIIQAAPDVNPSRPLDILRKPKAVSNTGELPDDVVTTSRLSKVMTWTKFKSTVLPTVDQMWVKFTREPVGLYTLMTQSDPDANPILVWDKPDNRCPISWYTYVSGQPMSVYGGSLSKAYRVTGLLPNPAMRPELPELSRSNIGQDCDFMLLEGLEDSKFSVGGVRLFPEIIRRDLQTDVGIRRVIEQYSSTAQVDTDTTAVVSVPSITGSVWIPYVFVRTLSGSYEAYSIDRLD